MNRKRLIAASIAAAFGFSTAALAAGDKQSGAPQDEQQKSSMSQDKGSGAAGGTSSRQSGQGSAASGASASSNAPMIVLVPMVVAAAPEFSNGCWARLYDSTDFRGNTLALVGPVDMPNMRTAFGTDWSGQFDSIAVGPKARLTVYDNENYGEKAATFKPSQKVADLDEKMGTFENISSVKVACTGGTPTAQQEKDGGAATGGTAGGKPQK